MNESMIDRPLIKKKLNLTQLKTKMVSALTEPLKPTPWVPLKEGLNGVVAFTVNG